jgi:23S rRNA pseudouridine2605 synthase
MKTMSSSTPSASSERGVRGQRERAKASERIAKVMARAGLCSRREAEDWIAAGRVCVNGAVISSPALNVSAADVVTVDGQALPARERTRLFLYHKPRGLVTTHADPEKRPTIFAGLPKHLPRLVSVGRLDLATEGLLLLTNDGGLARVLELPQTGWLRRYRVRAHGRVTQAQLDALRAGIEIDGIRYGPVEATLDRLQASNVWLTLAIREGKNREVRNVLRALGLQVNRLIRISFGPFQLGDLPEGAVHEVKTRTVREQIGERLARAAGADFEAPPHAPPNGRGGRSLGRDQPRPPSAKKVQHAPPLAKEALLRDAGQTERVRRAGRLLDRKGRGVTVERIEGPVASRPRAPGPRPPRPRGRR